MAERGRMKKRLFTDIDFEPSDRLLEKHLGDAIRFYRAIAAISGDYQRRWQFNRGNGWILRAHDSMRALYYLIAFDQGIEISLTVRDSEREDFLKCAGLEESYPELAAGTKYPGGYALRFEIENDDACRSASHFLAHLMKTRGPSPAFRSKRTIKTNGTRTKIASSRQRKLLQPVPNAVV